MVRFLRITRSRLHHHGIGPPRSRACPSDHSRRRARGARLMCGLFDRGRAREVVDQAMAAQDRRRRPHPLHVRAEGGRNLRPPWVGSHHEPARSVQASLALTCVGFRKENVRTVAQLKRYNRAQASGSAFRVSLKRPHRGLDVFGVSAGSKYRVSVGPKPDIWTKTGSASVRAKWFTPPGSE
jgi:hypothetical protein